MRRINLLLEIAFIAGVLLCCAPAFGQVEHVGVTAGVAMSSGDGNGTGYNAQAHVFKNVARLGDHVSLMLAAQGGGGLDLKLYLKEYGLSGRGRFTGRAYVGRHFFLEGGAQAGLVRYRPQNPADGYSKYVWNPLAGGGVTVYPRAGSSITASYQYLFEKNVWGSGPGVNRPEFIDGRQSAQRGGIYAAINLPEKSRGLLLVSAEFTRGRYLRSAERYGQALVGPYISNAVTFSVGYGWKF